MFRTSQQLAMMGVHTLAILTSMMKILPFWNQADEVFIESVEDSYFHPAMLNDVGRVPLPMMTAPIPTPIRLLLNSCDDLVNYHLGPPLKNRFHHGRAWYS
jgi:hypothetical protein